MSFNTRKSIYQMLWVFFFISITIITKSVSSIDEIPYSPSDKICEICTCLTAQDESDHKHFVLSCSTKNLQHILGKWPDEFGTNHTGVEIVASFSGNTIPLLQQLPATKAKLSFSCRHCGITEMQSPTFIDVPNIIRLDLSWNKINSDILRPETFRGPYTTNRYEPIALEELNLSFNEIQYIDSKIFEHTPKLKKLILSYNKISILDESAITALGSVVHLKYLDLSYNNLKEFPINAFKSVENLNTLLLQGNNLSEVPKGLNKLGKKLKVLNLSENPITNIKENSFDGMSVLTKLNISGMEELETIEYRTFDKITSLEVLLCRNNPKMKGFDFSGLKSSKNLKIFDISNCYLSSLNFDVELTSQENSTKKSTELKKFLPNTAIDSNNNKKKIITWRKLRFPKLSNNPWHCDCTLIKALEVFKIDQGTSMLIELDENARCSTPDEFAGSRIFQLITDDVCQISHPRRLRIPIHEPPQFLRPRSIALTIIAMAVVVALGLILGFVIVMLKRRLQKNDSLGYTTPIRYTTVENTTY